jgi:hypothetical protein
MFRALALGGRPFIERCINQPRTSFCKRLEVREEMRWARSMWGSAIPSFRALNGAKKKEKQLTLGSPQLMMQHTTTNQKWIRYTRGGVTRGEHAGGMTPSFWEALDVERR